MEVNAKSEANKRLTDSLPNPQVSDEGKERKARRVKEGFQPYAPKKSRVVHSHVSEDTKKTDSSDKNLVARKLSPPVKSGNRTVKGTTLHRKKSDTESKTAQINNNPGKKYSSCENQKKSIKSGQLHTGNSPHSKSSSDNERVKDSHVLLPKGDKKVDTSLPVSNVNTPSSVNCSSEYLPSSATSCISTETSDWDDSSVADANDTIAAGDCDTSLNVAPSDSPNVIPEPRSTSTTVSTIDTTTNGAMEKAAKQSASWVHLHRHDMRTDGNVSTDSKDVKVQHVSKRKGRLSKENKNSDTNKPVTDLSKSLDQNQNSNIKYKVDPPVNADNFETEKCCSSSSKSQNRKSSVERINKNQSNGAIQKPRVHFADVDKKQSTLASNEQTPRLTIENLKSEISERQSRLKDLLDSGFTSVEIISDVINEAAKLQDLYLEIIVNHQKESLEMDAEGCLWKNSFHNVISGFRRHVEKESTSSSFSQFICSSFWTYLQNSDLFLENLLTLLQDTFEFNLKVYCSDIYKAPPSSKKVKFALRSSYFINLYLGDIERYVTDLRQDGDYSKAITKYKQAMRLAPKNGKSYNQLAVVSVLTRHKLDAVYYYVRSLDTSNAIQSARDRLTLIFHDIRKKAMRYSQERIATELSRKAEMAMMLSRQNDFHMFVEDDHTRDEFWEFFTQGRRQKFVITRDGHVVPLIQAPDVDQRHSEIDKRSLKDINRAFVIHYLFVHCKLYTRIGLDSFLDDHSETLNELQVLVKQPIVSALKRESLIKYVAINMFSVTNLYQKQEDQSSILHNGPLDLAIIFSMEMVQHLMNACAEQLKISSGQDICHQFLPAVHAWLKWMVLNLSLLKMSSLMSIVSCWESYAAFLNCAVCSNEKETELVEDADSDIPPMLLYEDVVLAGMKMLSMKKTETFHGHPATMIADECKARLKQIISVSKDIASTKILPIQYDEDTKEFTVAPPDVIASSPTKTVIPELDDQDDSLLENNDNLQEDADDVIIEDTDNIDEQGMTNAVLELKARKQQVEIQLKEQQRLLEDRKQLIEKNAMQAKVIFCNKPQYIVMDTNCFISALNVVNVLVQSQQFGVIIPLIVVNELDGLKSGLFVDRAPTDQLMVSRVQDCARQALAFLEDCFSSNQYSIKAVTNQGTELGTIAFRTETFSSDRGNNDDVILNCCMKYCENEKRKPATQGEQLVVERKLVLLTDDKNLRLKAHRCNVPATGIGIFAHMAMGFA